ncbi:hypothetical protein TNCV_4868881 [Trichonephila clavipes]|nr:hypothetical protein TNCV_4868881 [Trichonephila clavipes]
MYLLRPQKGLKSVRSKNGQRACSSEPKRASLGRDLLNVQSKKVLENHEETSSTKRIDQKDISCLLGSTEPQLYGRADWNVSYVFTNIQMLRMQCDDAPVS